MKPTSASDCPRVEPVYEPPSAASAQTWGSVMWKIADLVAMSVILLRRAQRFWSLHYAKLTKSVGLGGHYRFRCGGRRDGVGAPPRATPGLARVSRGR